MTRIAVHFSRAVACCAAALAVAAAAPPVTFVPVRQDFSRAAGEYRRIWCSEGVRIVAALERVTGFSFPASAIDVFVADGTPMTSFDGRTIWLKASYPAYYKEATLVHELGHRLAFTMPRSADLDDHRLLYLFLYDVWTELYGADFAARMAAIERRIPGRYDYDAAWAWALSLSREQRQARLAALRSGQRPDVTSPAAVRAPPGCAPA